MESEPEKITDAGMMPEWQRYERLVARLIADQLSTDYCVTPNARFRARLANEASTLKRAPGRSM